MFNNIIITGDVVRIKGKSGLFKVVDDSDKNAMVLKPMAPKHTTGVWAMCYAIVANEVAPINSLIRVR